MLRGENVYRAIHPLFTEMDDGGGEYRLIDYNLQLDSIVKVVKWGTDRRVSRASLRYEAVVHLTIEKGVQLGLSFRTPISTFREKITGGDKCFKEVTVAYQLVPTAASGWRRRCHRRVEVVSAV